MQFVSQVTCCFVLLTVPLLVVAGEPATALKANRLTKQAATVLEHPDGHVAAFRDTKNGPELLLLSPKDGQVTASLPVDNGMRGQLLPIKVADKWLLISHNSPRHDGWHDRGMLSSSSSVFDLANGNRLRLRLNRKTVMHHDLTRVVQLRDSELWKAVYDWGTGALRDEEKIGAWKALNKMVPIGWAGNMLYLHNPSNPDQPTVRISLDDGAITELRLDLSKGGTYFSPNGRYAVLIRNELLFVLDLVRGETSTLSNRFDYKHPLGINAAYWNSQLIVRSSQIRQANGWKGGSLWFNEHTLLLPSLVGGLAVIDVGSPRIRIDYMGQPPFDYYYHVHSSSNTGRVKASAIMRVGDRVLMSPIPGIVDRPFLYDLEKKMIQPIGLNDNNISWHHRWIDASRFVSEVNSGSLQNVGTWVHNLRNGNKKKLSTQGLDSLLGFNAGAGLVYFRSNNGTVQVVSLADASTIEQPWMDGMESVRSIGQPHLIKPVDQEWKQALPRRYLPEQDIKTMSPILIDSLRYRRQLIPVKEEHVRFAKQLRDKFEDYRFYYHDRHALLKLGLQSLAAGGAELAPGNTGNSFERSIQNIQKNMDFSKAFSRSKFRAYVFDSIFHLRAKNYEYWTSQTSSKQQKVLEVCRIAADDCLARHLERGLTKSYLKASNLTPDKIQDAMFRAMKRVGYGYD